MHFIKIACLEGPAGAQERSHLTDIGDSLWFGDWKSQYVPVPPSAGHHAPDSHHWNEACYLGWSFTVLCPALEGQFPVVAHVIGPRESHPGIGLRSGSFQSLGAESVAAPSWSLCPNYKPKEVSAPQASRTLSDPPPPGLSVTVIPRDLTPPPGSGVGGHVKINEE